MRHDINNNIGRPIYRKTNNMKEFKIYLHLAIWFIKPQFFKDKRNIKIDFLCFTINILKNKKNGR